MPKLSLPISDIFMKPFYSEYVYGGCLIVWDEMNGANGCSIGDFVCIETLVAPRRTTALHELISGAITFIDSELFYDYPENEIETHRSVVLEAGLSYPIDAERRILDGSYTYDDKSVVYSVIAEATKRIIVPSVFQTLFSDRNFISEFQIQLRELLIDNLGELPAGSLTGQKKLYRSHLPKWLRKGIFFRDKGICQLCGKDISGLRSPLDEIHIDHIVPLAQYGNNDPTNFQLTCRNCNVSKGATFKLDRSRFMPYWQSD